jgi:hypothetical protein
VVVGWASTEGNRCKTVALFGIQLARRRRFLMADLTELLGQASDLNGERRSGIRSVINLGIPNYVSVEVPAPSKALVA